MRIITPISHIMTRKPIRIEPKTPLAAIHEIFEKNRLHHLPVVKSEKVVGLVSQTDYLKVIRNVFDNKHEGKKNIQLLKSMLAKDVMTKDVKTLLQTATLGDALQLFKENSFHSVVVVDKDNHLRGIVTAHDLILRLERKLLSDEAAYSVKEAKI